MYYSTEEDEDAELEEDEFEGDEIIWRDGLTVTFEELELSGVFTFPYIMPAWTLALFWENFFKNVNIGLKTSNGIMAAVFGL